MTDAFTAALTLVLQQEGGRVDDPHDPGGRTDHGITQAVYTAYRRARGLGEADVYGIDADTVAALYRAHYAEAIRFDALPAGVGYCVLDAAVNSGPVQAARWLQRALGVPVDGHIGLVTLDAVRTARPAELVNAICDARLGFLRHLPTWLRFGRGWRSRVAFVRSHALALIAPAAA